jgi:hypothetical protein
MTEQEGNWLFRHVLDSLEKLHTGVGSLQGEFSGFKDEMVGRMVRLEKQVNKIERQRPRQETAWLQHLPWQYLLTIALAIVVGMFGWAMPEWLQAALSQKP